MTAKAWVGICIGCCVVTAVLVFVAVERYQDNAAKVAAFNEMRHRTPFGGMMGDLEMKPATPAATKYALFFALLSAGGAVVCLVLASKAKTGGGLPKPPPTFSPQ